MAATQASMPTCANNHAQQVDELLSIRLVESSFIDAPLWELNQGRKPKLVAMPRKARLQRAPRQNPRPTVPYQLLGAADAFGSVIPGSSSKKEQTTIQKRPISDP